MVVAVVLVVVSAAAERTGDEQYDEMDRIRDGPIGNTYMQQTVRAV